MKIDIQGLKGKAELSLRRNSPQILVVGGIVSLIGAGVLACLATKKLDAVQEDHKAQKERIENRTIKPSEDPEEQKAEIQKDLKKEQTHYILEIAKLYSGPAILAVGGAFSILKGNDIWKKRNLALAAAYTTLDGAYREYRERVIDRFGEEVDKELRTGTHKEKIEVTETDENGKEKKVKTNALVAGPKLSGYARYFAYGDSKAAEPNADYNEMFLKGMQTTFNKMLKMKGFVFLNDVYEALVYERTIAGQSVGWVYDRHRDDHGDNCIDLRIEEVYRVCEDRPGSWEKVHIIDPNVDGDILDHLIENGLIEK